MRYRTRRTGRLMLLALLVLAGGFLAIWLLSAWSLMLFIGIAHRDWWPLMPTMSYHAALILTLFSTVGTGIAVAVGSKS